jgi:hypothetical protein
MFLLLAASACSERAEGLVVSLQTDFVPALEFDSVRARVAGDTLETGVSAEDSFARGRLVAVFDDLQPSRHELNVDLMQGSAVVATRRVSVQFSGSLLVNVVISRSCRDVVCGERETCVAGVCASPQCVTGAEPECPRRQCSVGSDCMSSTACVEPSCAAGICLETDSSSRCATGEVCVPDRGCVGRPTESDAGQGLDARGADVGAPDALAPTDAGTCDATTCTAGPCETATCVAGRCERASTCGATEMCCSGVCSTDCGMVACAGRPAGEVCRPSAGACDVEERCDGGPTCPADALAPASTTCRAAAGECDVAERCTSGTAACPPNAFEGDGTPCSMGSCDGLGMCSGACVPGARCNTGNPCEVGQRVCPSGACVGAGAGPAGVVCRASAGACDEEETCTGTSTACPADRFQPSSTECRTERGVCDRAEMCTGASAACPADTREPASTVCRNAAAGGCDVAENCTGSSDACPANTFASASTVCRNAAGACDVADRCTGGSAVCPPDNVSPAGTTCRAALGTCDAPESCDGSTVTCPAEPGRQYGDACCAGASCSGGSACLGTRCAVFGGTYALDQSGMAPLPCRPNPFVAGSVCECPAGFIAQQLDDLDFAADEGNGWDYRHYVCVVAGADTTATDFAGAYARTTTGNPFSSGCASACTSGTCSCPGGSTPITATGVHFLSGSSLDCEREVTFCGGTAAPLSFGGSFWRLGVDTVCSTALPFAQRCLANPETGGCSCPAGFTEQVTPMSQQRTIERGFGPEHWYCRGELVYCGRFP